MSKFDLATARIFLQILRQFDIILVLQERLLP
jgi:hypothetical protein